MYAKIFQSIYDGTLVEDWRALITFEQLLILSDADGIVDMTAHAIARRTGIPIEHIEAGLRFLEQPDPRSRTATAEGRRLIRLDESRDWGWQIVNHQTYRDMRTADDRREYMRKYMKDYRNQDKKPQQNQSSCKQESLPELTVSEGKPALGQLANTYTDTNTDTDTKETTLSGSPPDAPVVVKRNFKAEAIQVLEFLNAKAKRNFEPLTAEGKPTASLKIIIARLKDGATLDDARSVVVLMCRKWLGDDKMRDFLQPSTLFRPTNFENYRSMLRKP